MTAREPRAPREPDLREPCPFDTMLKWQPVRLLRFSPDAPVIMNERHQLIVLDQNVMRDSKVLSLALDRCCRENLQLLIPDVAGFELSKGSQQFDTWHRSLEYLRCYPEFVTVSRKLTRMLGEENETGCSCPSLVDRDSATCMREVLHGLDHDDTFPLRRIVDGPMRRLMPASLAAWSNSDEHKQWIIKIRDELSRMMDEEALKRLRKSPQEGLAEWLSSIDGIRFVFQGIRSRGASDEVALRLSSMASVSAAFLSAFGALAVHWLAFGGLDVASPNKLTNDLLDMEYAILGSLSVALLSKDKRVSDICGAMSTASRERCAWFREGRHGI